MFGSHLSIAGGMHHALTEARRLDMDCVQVFTKNQRQWSAPPLRDEQVDAWRDAMGRTGITDVVSHDSYLINLASPDRGNRGKSIKLFEDEMLRCDRLAIPWLVTHPGAHMGDGEDKGLARVADALNRLHDKHPGLGVVTCLEATAGQGTSLGWRFEHLAAIIDQVEAPERLGVCLDTAHLMAAGYDLTSAAGATRTLRECNKVLGKGRVKVLHLNDSKVERGKRVDRHAHLGHGTIPNEAMAVFVNRGEFRKAPKILETPKETDDQGREWDAVNLAVLRGMLKRAGRA